MFNSAHPPISPGEKSPVTYPRLPKSLEHAKRIRSLIKQAEDALFLISEERLNLDTDSRNAVNEARQSVSTFDYIVSQQPTKL